MSEVYIILYLHYEFMIRIKLLINKNIIGMFHLSTTPTNDLWRVYTSITQNNVVGGGGGEGACEYKTSTITHITEKQPPENFSLV